MPVTSYYSMGGALIGERTGTSGRTDYVPDAIGSVVATLDQAGNLTFTAAYKPYGETIVSTGTVPRFTWVGTFAYNSGAGAAYVEYLAGARFGSTKCGCWTSVDLLWPREPAYVYARSSPVLVTDPSGMWPNCVFTEAPTPTFGKPTKTIGPNGSSCSITAVVVANWVADTLSTIPYAGKLANYIISLTTSGDPDPENNTSQMDVLDGNNPNGLTKWCNNRPGGNPDITFDGPDYLVSENVWYGLDAPGIVWGIKTRTKTNPNNYNYDCSDPTPYLVGAGFFDPPTGYSYNGHFAACALCGIPPPGTYSAVKSLVKSQAAVCTEWCVQVTVKGCAKDGSGVKWIKTGPC